MKIILVINFITWPHTKAPLCSYDVSTARIEQAVHKRHLEISPFVLIPNSSFFILCQPATAIPHKNERERERELLPPA
jgi:hypothetical protein